MPAIDDMAHLLRSSTNRSTSSSTTIDAAEDDLGREGVVVDVGL